MADKIAGVIQTHYRGIRFRSRLEARWAVFFDHLGIEWKYEYEGYKSGSFNYLPDFYLPKFNTWAEVKGSEEMLRNDAPKLHAVLDFASPLPWFHGSYDEQLKGESSDGVILLGDIPFSHHIVVHPVLQHSADYGLVRTWGLFAPFGGVWKFKGFGHLTVLHSLMGFDVAAGTQLAPNGNGWTLQTKVLFGAGPAFQRLADAYTAARNARFEHGEQGARGR